MAARFAAFVGLLAAAQAFAFHQPRPPGTSPETAAPGASPRNAPIESPSGALLPPALRPPWRGRPISLSLRDADLVEVLRSFAKLAGTNLIVHPGVSGKVTLELHDVPWDQALAVILKTHGLGVELDGTRRWRLVASPSSED